MASTSVARVANMNTNDGRHYTKHFSLEAGRMPALLICTRQEMWPLVAYLTLRSDGSGYSSLADVVTISNGLITIDAGTNAWGAGRIFFSSNDGFTFTS